MQQCTGPRAVSTPVQLTAWPRRGYLRQPRSWTALRRPPLQRGCRGQYRQPRFRLSASASRRGPKPNTPVHTRMRMRHSSAQPGATVLRHTRVARYPMHETCPAQCNSSRTPSFCRLLVFAYCSENRRKRAYCTRPLGDKCDRTASSLPCAASANSCHNQPIHNQLTYLQRRRILHLRQQAPRETFPAQCIPGTTKTPVTHTSTTATSRQPGI